MIQIIVKCIVDGFSCINLYALGWLNKGIRGALLLNDVISASVFLLECLVFYLTCPVFFSQRNSRLRIEHRVVGVISEKKNGEHRLEAIRAASCTEQHTLSCQMPRADFGRLAGTGQVRYGILHTEERNRKSFAFQGLPDDFRGKSTSFGTEHIYGHGTFRTSPGKLLVVTGTCVIPIASQAMWNSLRR